MSRISANRATSCRPDMPGPLSLSVLLIAPIVYKYFHASMSIGASATIGPIFQISQSGMKGEHLDKLPAMSKRHLAALSVRTYSKIWPWLPGLLSTIRRAWLHLAPSSGSLPKICLPSKKCPSNLASKALSWAPACDSLLLASNVCTGLLGRFSRVSWVFGALCHVFGPWYGAIGNVVRVAGHGRGLPHSLPWLAVLLS